MELKPGYKQTEVGVIPEDWECVAIAALAARRQNAIVGGPFGSDLVSNDYVDFGVPVIRGNNMGGRFISGDFAFVAPDKAKALKANTAVSGDIIFTQRVTLGQISLVPDGGYSQFVVSQSQMKLTPDRQRSDPDYVLHYFSSGPGQRQILDSAIQTGVPHTNLGILKAYKVPLPPTLAEQEAIAGALSDADALIESLERLIAKKRVLKQGAMQELLTGKRRLPGFTGRWVRTTFGKVSKIRNDKINTFCAPDAEFCIELEQIGQGTGQIDGFLDARERVSSKYLFRAGDVLFGRLRPYLRKFWCANRAGVCSTEIWPLIPDGGTLLAPFLNHIVRTDAFIEAASAAYGTHMPRADWRVLSEYPVGLPPTLPEQTAIAAVLSDMDAEIAALDNKLAKARAIKQGMMHNLLTGRIRLI